MICCPKVSTKSMLSIVSWCHTVGSPQIWMTHMTMYIVATACTTINLVNSCADHKKRLIFKMMNAGHDFQALVHDFTKVCAQNNLQCQTWRGQFLPWWTDSHNCPKFKFKFCCNYSIEYHLHCFSIAFRQWCRHI
jgi:hypothetical protein